MQTYKVVSDYLHICGYELEKNDYLIIKEDEELEDGFRRAFDPLLGDEEPLTISSRKYLGVVRQAYLDVLVKNHEIRLETK